MSDKDRRYRYACAEQLVAGDPQRAVGLLAQMCSSNVLEEELVYSEQRPTGSPSTAASVLNSPAQWLGASILRPILRGPPGSASDAVTQRRKDGFSTGANRLPGALPIPFSTSHTYEALPAYMPSAQYARSDSSRGASIIRTEEAYYHRTSPFSFSHIDTAARMLRSHKMDLRTSPFSSSHTGIGATDQDLHHSSTAHASAELPALPIRPAASPSLVGSSRRVIPDTCSDNDVTSKVHDWVIDQYSKDVPADDGLVPITYTLGKCKVMGQFSLRTPYDAFLTSLTTLLGCLCREAMDGDLHFARVSQEFQDGEIVEFCQGLDDDSMMEVWPYWTEELLETVQDRPLKQIAFLIEKPG